MAAGIGSRFGGGVKQLEPVGRNGELIIDYSIADAVKAGFNKIIFIIRRDIEDEFRAVIGDRTEKQLSAQGVKVEYAFQELIDPPAGRVKPWGTGQAVLSCKGMINGPFAVINADDYYGDTAFASAMGFLTQEHADNEYGMMGYVLKNTLSDNGCVTRGVCRVEDGRLAAIKETKQIVKTADGAETDGVRLDTDSIVSMNFWMLPAAFVDVLEKGFPVFRAALKDPMKDEYLLPTIIGGQLSRGEVSVEVIKTDAVWYGMTYKEDVPAVRAAIQSLRP